MADLLPIESERIISKKERRLKDRPVALFVEANEQIINGLRPIFEKNNVNLIVARDGEIAFDLAILYGQAIKIILLDISSPQTDGFNFLSNLKQNSSLKDIPVIVISDSFDYRDIEKAKQLGAVDYLINKQLSFNQVVETVKKYIK